MGQWKSVKERLTFWTLLLVFAPVFLIILPVKKGKWCYQLYWALHKVTISDDAERQRESRRVLQHHAHHKKSSADDSPARKSHSRRDDGSGVVYRVA